MNKCLEGRLAALPVPITNAHLDDAEHAPSATVM